MGLSILSDPCGYYQTGAMHSHLNFAALIALNLRCRRQHNLDNVTTQLDGSRDHGPTHGLVQLSKRRHGTHRVGQVNPPGRILSKKVDSGFRTLFAT